MKTGIDLIAEERARQQVGEGFDARRDDQYVSFELAAAASTYVFHAALPPEVRESLHHKPAIEWPWSMAWWKPAAGTSPEARIRDLQKAGALIAAEIDRLQRLPRD